MLFSLVACGQDEGTGSMVVDDTFSITDSGIVVTGQIDSGGTHVGIYIDILDRNQVSAGDKLVVYEK